MSTSASASSRVAFSPPNPPPTTTTRWRGPAVFSMVIPLPRDSGRAGAGRGAAVGVRRGRARERGLVLGLELLARRVVAPQRLPRVDLRAHEGLELLLLQALLGDLRRQVP